MILSKFPAAVLLIISLAFSPFSGEAMNAPNDEEGKPQFRPPRRQTGSLCLSAKNQRVAPNKRLKSKGRSRNIHSDTSETEHNSALGYVDNQHPPPPRVDIDCSPGGVHPSTIPPKPRNGVMSALLNRLRDEHKAVFGEVESFPEEHFRKSISRCPIIWEGLQDFLVLELAKTQTSYTPQLILIERNLICRGSDEQKAICKFMYRGMEKMPELDIPTVSKLTHLFGFYVALPKEGEVRPDWLLSLFEKIPNLEERREVWLELYACAISEKIERSSFFTILKVVEEFSKFDFQKPLRDGWFPLRGVLYCVSSQESDHGNHALSFFEKLKKLQSNEERASYIQSCIDDEISSAYENDPN